jgi:hypothetical protein
MLGLDLNQSVFSRLVYHDHSSFLPIVRPSQALLKVPAIMALPSNLGV